MTYVIFDMNGRGKVSINRANIVGFRTPDPRVVWTNVLLDSGTEITLNGMSQDEAEKILKLYDAKKTNE